MALLRHLRVAFINELLYLVPVLNYPPSHTPGYNSFPDNSEKNVTILKQWEVGTSSDVSNF